MTSRSGPGHDSPTGPGPDTHGGNRHGRTAADADAPVDRCLLVGMDGHRLPPELRDWLADGLGGVVLFAHNIADRDQLRELVADIRSAGSDVLVALDEEGGDVTRLHAATGSPNPGNLALGAVDDPQLTREVAAGIGADLAAVGVNLDLAPSADVNTNPDNPIIGTRSFGADPDLVAAHVVAYLEGLHSAGVTGCAKHFPGHGATAVDSHLALPTFDGDIEPHLAPFRAAIGAGVRAILTAHVRFPALDDEPATLSHPILTELLRDRLGFTGAVITDSMTMNAIADGVGVAAGAERALGAGADLVCLTGTFELQRQVRDRLREAVAEGRLTGARVVEAADRVRALSRPPETRAAVEPADPDRLTAAARAALRADPRLPGLTAPPYVLELSPPRRGIELAAGSLLAMLSARDPRVTGTRLTPPAAPQPDGPDPDLAAALAGAADRPLVVVVRDAHIAADQRARLAGVLAARPDAVVVGIGTCGDADLAPGRYLGTRGGARVNLTAAADLLVGGHP